MKLYVSIVDFQLHLPKTLSNAKMVYIWNVDFDEWNNIGIHDFSIRDHVGFRNRCVAMSSMKIQNCFISSHQMGHFTKFETLYFEFWKNS